MKRHPIVQASAEALVNYINVSVTLASLSGVKRQAQARAVVYYPGIFDTDLRTSLDVLNEDLCSAKDAVTHVLVAGHNVGYADAQYLERRELIKIFDPRFYISTQVVAAHTGEQARWVAQMVPELGIDLMELNVPAFHLPRAYLTTLKAFMDAGLDENVLLLPRAIPMMSPQPQRLIAPFEEGTYYPHELIGGEADKIMLYQDYVASFAQLQQHLDYHL